MGYSRAGHLSGSVGDDRAGRLVNRCAAIRQEAHRPFRALDRSSPPKGLRPNATSGAHPLRLKSQPKFQHVGVHITRQSGPNSETGMRLMSFVRDNGCGINPEAVQRECDSHWGLRGMRERAENINARFAVWSRTGAGTEVCVAIPIDVTKRQPMDGAATESRRESTGSRAKRAATT